MRLTPQTVLAPILAVLMLVLVLNVTLGALRDSGAWQRRRPAPRMMRPNPYAALDHMIATRPAALPAASLRNPFALGPAPVASDAVQRPRKVVPPPPPPKPVLTAIIWDNDPRATIRWKGRDFSVRPNGLFDDFKVVSISRDEVVLERGGESLTLRMITR